MSTDAPRLHSIDDRLARIEDLLVKLTTKIDHVDTLSEATHNTVIGLQRALTDLRRLTDLRAQAAKLGP